MEETWCARDPDTGTSLAVKTTSELETLMVEVAFLDAKNFRFAIGIERKFPEREFRLNDPDNPTMLLQLGSLKRVAQFRNGTREENTSFVRYILSGLSAINRHRPLSRNAFFYTDRYRYEGRDIDFCFDVPSESEIMKL